MTTTVPNELTSIYRVTITRVYEISAESAENAQSMVEQFPELWDSDITEVRVEQELKP